MAGGMGNGVMERHERREKVGKGGVCLVVREEW